MQHCLCVAHYVFHNMPKEAKRNISHFHLILLYIITILLKFSTRPKV